MTTTETPTTTTTDGERADILETLRNARHFLRHTVAGLTDEQSAQRPTVSELCPGGLIKHVALVEEAWADFIVHGTAAMEPGADAWTEHTEGFRMLPGETLAAHLARYEEVARRTDELVATLPNLDVAHALPEAPWFEAGKRWSARRALLHIATETAQHAGHADILRETIDGQKSMG
ncbi:MAG: DinB family protein [Pseudonocardia sp.]|nr:DinB family protein [Pseudonocardia sp.]